MTRPCSSQVFLCNIRKYLTCVDTKWNEY